jgi:hypothetical protein
MRADLGDTMLTLAKVASHLYPSIIWRTTSKATFLCRQQAKDVSDRGQNERSAL